MAKNNLAKVIIFANQKGGVGKTTSTVNVSHWFALHGKKVLAIDLDSQGNLANAFGVPRNDGLYRWLTSGKIDSSIANVRENLDAVLNGKMYSAAQDFVRNVEAGRDYLLNQLLEEPREKYDMIFLDTAPSKDIFHMLALIASDILVIPSQMNYLSFAGIEYITSSVHTLSKLPSVVPPYNAGVLPTMYDLTTNETKENVENLRKSLGNDQVLPPIPMDVTLRQAESRGKTVWEIDPNSRAAIGYEMKADKLNSMGRYGGYLHVSEILNSILEE